MSTRYSLVVMGSVEPDALDRAKATVPATLPTNTFRWAAADEPLLIATSQSREPLARLLEHLWNSGIRVMLVDDIATETREITPNASPLTMNRMGQQVFRPMNGSDNVRITLPNTRERQHQRRVAFLILAFALIVVVYVLTRS